MTNLLISYLCICTKIYILITIAAVDLTPAKVVYVCPGGQLNLTCKSNASFIEWNVTVPQYQWSLTRLLSNIGTAHSILPIWINESTIFNISKMFNETMTLPLISMMFSNNVTTSINGTLIRCTEYYMHLDVWMMNTITTRLHIIEPGTHNHGRFKPIASNSDIIMYVHAAPPSVAISEYFGTNSVIVTLEWIQESDVTYNVSIFPQVPVEILRGSSVQLPLLYNTDYNVRVIATVCGQNNATTTILLSYGEISVRMSHTIP